MDTVDVSGIEDETGALGEAIGHEEAFAWDCDDFLGGKGESAVALCMGHPGLSCQLKSSDLFAGIAYWRSGIVA